MSQKSHIETRMGEGGPSSYIAGTRVRVSDIARLYRLIESETMAERIRHSLPHLSEAQIEDALKYWREHEEEIEKEIAEEERIFNSIPPAF